MQEMISQTAQAEVDAVDVLKDLVDGCKEERMTIAQMRNFLPAAIVAAGQSNPESGLLTKPMDELLQEAERLFNA